MLAHNTNNIQVYLATHNQNKVKEIQAIIPEKVTLLSISQLEKEISWVECGLSFYENALIKAQTVFKYCNDNTLAEDSGLVIEALNGEPGIYSKRYSGKDGSDLKNIEKVLNKLKASNCKTREAFFITCLVYINKKGHISSFTGKCHGTIAQTAEGLNGFGYDPIFIPKNYKQSFAILPYKEKLKISHRTKAINQWIQSL